MLRKQALAQQWIDQDDCDGCRNPQFAEPDAPAPVRPHRLPHDGPILFISEAAPRTGGFWKPLNGDAVRRLLLPALPRWPQRLDWNCPEALDWFVEEGYFLVQAIKWPLAPHAKRSYAGLTTAEKCSAIEHAVRFHLLAEIELSEPRAIIAFGAAAWDAGLLLADLYGQGRLDEPRLRAARLRHQVLRPASTREISLHVTYLPGTRNEVKGWLPVIHADIGVFLRCINDGINCEACERKVTRTQMQPVSKTELQNFTRLLRAVGLSPRPRGMTSDELVTELMRRIAKRQVRHDPADNPEEPPEP